MSSLARCLKKMGKLVSPEEANILRDLADKHVGDGFQIAEAEEQAVTDTLADLDADLSKIVAQTKPPAVAAQPAPEVPVVPFPYGAVIEGLPTVDFRIAPESSPQTAEAMAEAIRQNVAKGMQGDISGNRSLTRIGVVLQNPQGQVILAGLVNPQFTLRADGTRAVGEIAVQQMGRGNKQRQVVAGGDAPAHLNDVMAAGFQPVAVLHFAGQPAKIFQQFADMAEFDRSYGATAKTAATAGKLGQPKVKDKVWAAQQSEAELEAEKIRLAGEYQAAKTDEEREAIKKAIIAVYDKLDRIIRRNQNQAGNEDGGVAFRIEPAQIDTPEFKAWFRKSGVVDSEGAPKMVYHGSGNSFDEFLTTGSNDVGAHFSEGTRTANYFAAQERNKELGRFQKEFNGVVYPVFLSIQNPLYIRDLGRWDVWDVANEFNRVGLGTYEEVLSGIRAFEDKVKKNYPNGWNSRVVGNEGIVGYLKSKGYDGVKYLNRHEVVKDDENNIPQDRQAELKSAGRNRDIISDSEFKQQFPDAEVAWIAFDKSQIKSATGNRGSFDSTNPDIRFRTPEIQDAQRLPLDAARAQQFQRVVQRLRNMGAKVDVFAREFFAQGVAAEIEAKIAALEQRLPGAGPAMTNQLNRQLAQLRARLGEVGQARGAAFSPWHMALAVDDVLNADVGNLVTALHEAAEGLAMGLNPSVRGAIGRAVDQSLTELREQAQEAAARTGAPLAQETGAIDRLAETLAQKLAAEGIPDAPSLAQAIIRWVKDLYYRAAMALQAAFGAEPDGKMVLDWFENQLRRITGGDYDFRLARLMDRYLPEPMIERARRFRSRGTTPGGIADYYNPFSRRTEQPSALPDSAEAVGWNTEFQTAGLAIPDAEANARINVATINTVRAAMEKVHLDSKSPLPWADWWALVGTGEDPRTIPAALAERFPGIETATIGGDRMTATMNTLAAVDARAWLERIEVRAQANLAKSREAVEAEADNVVNTAREVNEIEGDRRNAQLQTAVLEKKMKDLVRRFVEDYRAGLTGAVEQGRLAEAVRQAEGLLSSDPIPDSYQKVFKSILDDTVSIWDYMRAIARLELPLSDLTSSEVRKAIRDNGDANETLKALAANKPLLVALAELARANSAQMDDINMAYLRNTEQYLKLHGELQAIRQATDAELKEMLKVMDEKGKAATFGERIQQQYLKRRRALRTARDRVKRATERAGAIETAQPGIAQAVEQAQIEGGTAPSEWMPVDGAVWREMNYADGQWTGTRRTLRFNADGTAVDSARILAALDRNARYLADNMAKSGGKTWQEVYRQTTELRRLDLQQAYPAAHWHRIFNLSAPLISDLRNMGGAEGAEGVRMMNKLQFIIQSHRDMVQTLSHKWSSAWQGVQKAAGIPDNGQFQEQIYDPVSYFLNTNPGLEEDAALRQATLLARRRLTKEPAADFDARMFALLRATKAGFEYLVKIGEDNGVFTRDERLKSELRNAVARGWLTSMRSMDAAVVQRIIRDMEKSGWKLALKKTADGKIEKVEATTFDDLTTEETSEENSETLAAAVQQLFPQGVVNDWLLPFINKGGVEVLKWEGEPIAQLDLQTAWQSAGGSILQWIDNLAQTIDLQPLTGPEGEEIEALPAFRLSVLRQLDALFGMEAKMAYEANQGRDLFDPMGAKPHVMMDARVSDLLPGEHLNFAQLDDQGARLLLSHIAFHGAFGRNGERMVTTLRDMTTKAKLRAEQYESIKETTRSGRLAHAIAAGWDYKQLELAAAKVKDVTKLERILRQFMSVGAAGGPFEEQRALMEVMNFIAGQIVDNPKTALYDVLSAVERPLAMRSLGPATIKASAKSLASAAKTAMGSVLEALHLHIMHASENQVSALTALEGSRNLPWRQATADIGAKGGQSPADMWFYRPLKFLRYVQNKGVAFPGQGEQRDFPRLAVVPGLGVNAWLGQTVAQGTLETNLGELESMVRHGIDHLAAHKDAAQDPAFRFKAADLGMGRADTGVFDWWQRKAPEFGLGTLEDIVRSSMAPAAKGERLFSKDQVLRVAQMYSQELAGQSSINTMPTALIDNPLLRMAFPLLRWPFWAMHHVNEGMNTADGRKTFASVMRGLGTLAMWNLPIGLAFTFMLDRYDEEATGKKSNLPPVGKTAALPFVGPVAEALTSDRSIPDTLKAYLVRMGRAGNVGGLAADVVGQFASPTDASSGRRVFSLDQRVLAMSQFLNFQQAMTNAMHQDWTTTWASVWSPLIRSVGGNAALHTLDIANKVLGLDNAESRLVMRINASSWLRGAASELDVPLRPGGMGTPTPMSVFTREMMHAAMAGDRIDFMEAYRHAKEAALKSVGNDPTVKASDRDDEAERRVLSGWRGRDPLSIFAHRPTDAQLNRLLSIMDEDGRVDVRSALQRYDQFTQMIKPSAFERAMNQRMNRMMAPPRMAMPRVGALF